MSSSNYQHIPGDGMESYAERAGVRLWATVEGTGVPLVLCAGGPGCGDYLAPVSRMLRDVARVIRFEAAGCGRSDPPPPYTVAGALADLEAVRLHYGLERWIVGGHSWGADLALLYALRYPERTLALVCLAGGRVHNDREWHRAYATRRDQGLEPSYPFDHPPNLVVNQQLNHDWKQGIQRPTLLREIAGMERPALFLYGEQDIRPSWPVEQVAYLMPDARWEPIADATHYLWVDQAELVAGRLRAFVEQVGSA